MAKFADRVKVGNTTAANAGSATTLTLGSAEAGYQAVPSSLDGETIRYVIEEGNTWEIGTGTYTHSGTTLTRSVTSSSNSNNAIAVTTNSKVFIAPVVDDLQFVQVYSSTSDLPSASSNHGRITHVHGDGAMYFAHGGNWVRLANHSDAYTLPTASGSTLGGVKIGTGLSIDGSGVVTASSSGIALTDLSVTQNSASGSGALTYNNSNGVFSYTPPASTSASGGTLEPVKETEFTASNNQTSFSVTYAVGNIAVFLNGSKLGAADFTATNGTSVVLATGATQNDLVEVVEYGAPFAAPYSSNIYTANGSSPFNSGNTVLTADYTQGKEAVYVNGVKLLSGTDYTTNTGGTTITFTSALSAGDKVELVEHGALADAASSFTDLTDTPSSLGTAGQVVKVNSAGNALEFADASSGVSVYTGLSGTDGTPSGATYLLNASSSAGDLAYVTANTGLYQNNGNGWYRIATVNTSPTISSPSTGTDITLATNGNPSTVTITAADVDEGTTLQYSYTVSTGSLTNGGGTTATVYGADGTSQRVAGTNYTDNVFKVDPTTNSSHAGSFSLTFNATDTINTAQTIQNFTLSFAASWGDRGTFAGGYNYTDFTPNSNNISYIDITTTGNSIDFGDLVVGRERLVGVSSGTYIVWSGSKYNGVSTSNRRKMDYITVATTGNASDFTGLDINNRERNAGTGDGDRGLFFGNGAVATNEISYITIEIPGSDAADFGDRTEIKRQVMATGNDTYALAAGGGNNSLSSANDFSNRIDRVTVQTTGNATDFGDLTYKRLGGTACSDSTRSVFTSGYDYTNFTYGMDYVTIATAGNATSFGNGAELDYIAGQSNGTRGVFKYAGNGNELHYITIQTTSNTTDFGDLNYKATDCAGASGFDS